MMKISRKLHAQFLDLEIKTQNEKFRQIAESAARQLLEEDKVFVAKFIKEEHGQIILKFPVNRGLPRKNQHFLGLLLPNELAYYRKWGSLSYRELIRRKLIHTELHCVWHQPSRNGKFILAGFRGISTAFVDRLVRECVVVIGPAVPPLDYLINLKKIVEKTTARSPAGKILDVEIPSLERPSAHPITDESPLNFVHSRLGQEEVIIIQGPPGTGKTYLMAQLCAQLLQENKSILVTALTNQALAELAEKEALADFCKEGKVKKTGLSVDEQRKIAGLLPAEKMASIKGELLLATFHKASELAAAIPSDPFFDVVIIDEASQAFLATFAGMRMLGRVNVWIGDPAQLPPIAVLNDDVVRELAVEPAIKGMVALSAAGFVPLNQLVHTYRLTERAAGFTGSFYSNHLKSTSSLTAEQLKYHSLPREIAHYLHPEGGPVLLKLPMPVGEKSPDRAIAVIARLVKELLQSDSKLEIAVLAFYVQSVNALVRSIYAQVRGAGRVLIDTVSRVQGLTCDVCIFLIPNTGYIRSLDQPLFNVATSRARRHTVIVGGRQIMEEIMDTEVQQFLQELDTTFSFCI